MNKLPASTDSNETYENGWLYELFEIVDSFVEEKMYSFLVVAVPVYMAAHIIVYFLRANNLW